MFGSLVPVVPAEGAAMPQKRLCWAVVVGVGVGVGVDVGVDGKTALDFVGVQIMLLRLCQLEKLVHRERHHERGVHRGVEIICWIPDWRTRDLDQTKLWLVALLLFWLLAQLPHRCIPRQFQVNEWRWIEISFFLIFVCSSFLIFVCSFSSPIAINHSRREGLERRCASF